jgi:acetyl-CoA C-acetyltransferase
VYIVDGARTPFLKATGKPGPFTPADLAVQCGRPLLLRQGFSPDQLDQVILGCVNVMANEMNPARISALRLGLGDQLYAYSVQINCGSGMQAIDCGFQAIRNNTANLVLAGGSESLSHAPLYFRDSAVDIFSALASARTLSQRLKTLSRFRLKHFKPVIGLLKGLTDPMVDMNMGQTAELLAYLFAIGRSEADSYAVQSHLRLAAAQQNGIFADEITPAFSSDGRVFSADNGVRADSSVDKLATLNPVFERPWGKVTAGNSSQVSDGASWIILASEEAVEKHGLEPMAKIVDSHWSALNPAVMGLGPALCSAELLKRHCDNDLGAVDLWEINEAFAAQVLACRKAWESPEFCKAMLGLDKPLGSLALDRLNINGGAISLGHPVAASGNRIVLHLANSLKRLNLKRGIASQCIGGGQGGAMLLEKV